MSVRIKYSEPSELVNPKLEDLDVESITLEDYKLQLSTTAVNNALIKSQTKKKEQTQKDSWINWTLSLSLEGLDLAVSGAEKFFKELDRIVQQITQLLKIIRLFGGNVNSISSLLKFAIKQLSKELKKIVSSLESTGIYVSLIIPDFDKKFPKYTIPIYGGYQEFISRVNATCMTSTDPDAPKFEENDKVGGVIFAQVAGVNDPDFLKNMIENFRALCGLFGLQKVVPSPPKKVKAIPGYYDKNGKKELGVKITWDAPDAPVGNFFIYRSKYSDGSLITVIVDGSEVDLKLFTDSEPIKKVKYIPGKAFYSYIDFDVLPEAVNFYKIYSVFGDDFLDRNPLLRAINSPIASPMISASVPKDCIPVSELKKYMNLAINGEFVPIIDLEGDWQSVSARGLISKPLDNVLTRLDALSEKLIGLVDTGSDALTSYLKFYGERVESLLDVIQGIKDISYRLSAFTLRGTIMVLNLPLEKGGMRGFVDRFNKACNTSNADTIVLKEDPKTKLEKFLVQTTKLQKNASIAKFNENGIMFGVILLYGIPTLNDPDRFKRIVPESKIGVFKNCLASSEKAISILLKMLGLE